MFVEFSIPSKNPFFLIFRNQQWLNCDDEKVSIMDPPHFKLDEVEKDTASSSESKKISNLKAEDSDVLEIEPTSEYSVSDEFKSASAYLLCYRERNAMKGQYPPIPDQIKGFIQERNSIHEKAVLEQKQKYFLFFY